VELLPNLRPTRGNGSLSLARSAPIRPKGCNGNADDLNARASNESDDVYD